MGREFPTFIIFTAVSLEDAIMKKTSTATYFLWYYYYCYSSVLSGNTVYGRSWNRNYGQRWTGAKQFWLRNIGHLRPKFTTRLT